MYALSNSAIFDDFERTQTQILRSRHSLMLNISEMAKDTAIVTINCQLETVSNFWMVPVWMILSNL